MTNRFRWVFLRKKYFQAKVYKIHEDAVGGISVSGATIKPIQGPADALR